MSITAASTKKANIGSPAQYSQPSRKGKKSWRKNVDIREVESGMEEIRAEERETGCVEPMPRYAIYSNTFFLEGRHYRRRKTMSSSR